MKKRARKPLTAYQIYKMAQKKELSDAEYKQLLISNGIIVKKNK